MPGRVGLVAVDGNPVATSGEADQHDRAAAGWRFELSGTVGDVATVVDGPRRAVEPQPVGEAESAARLGGIDDARRGTVGEDHVATLGVVAGDDAASGELHGPDPTPRAPGAPEDASTASRAWTTDSRPNGVSW